MTKILLKILSRLKLLEFLNFSVKKGDIRIPILGRLGYVNYYGTEKWMTEVLQKLLKNTNDSFIDIGVNVGQTLLKLKTIDRNFDYIGFEPNPICVFYVEQLIKLNRFQNCKIVPVGISKKTEVVSLNIFENDTDPSASIINDFRGNAKSEKTIIVADGKTIDLFQHKKIGILKIDVEGAELYVIEGLLDAIQANRPYILMEVLPAYTERTVHQGRLLRQNELIKHLNELRYSIMRILKNSDDCLNGFCLIKDMGRHIDWKMSDYLLVPDEKLSTLKL